MKQLGTTTRNDLASRMGRKWTAIWEQEYSQRLNEKYKMLSYCTVFQAEILAILMYSEFKAGAGIYLPLTGSLSVLLGELATFFKRKS